MTNEKEDYQAAQMIKDMRTGNYAPELILKRKTGYPTPDEVVNHYGRFRKKGLKNDADVLGAISGATKDIPGVNIVTGAISSIGNLFKKKPVGEKGWQSFFSSTPPLQGAQYYPTLSQILGAGFITDAKQLQAIKDTYNQSTGHGREGDWHFQVTNTKPLTIDWFKGDTEHFQTKAAQSVAVGADSPASTTMASQIAVATAKPVSMITPASQPITKSVLPSLAGDVSGTIKTLKLDNPLVMYAMISLAGIALYFIVKKMM